MINLFGLCCVPNLPLFQDFKLGIYTCEAEDRTGRRFKTLNIGLILVEFIFFNA